jgi:hypothetical protein
MMHLKHWFKYNVNKSSSSEAAAVALQPLVGFGFLT